MPRSFALRPGFHQVEAQFWSDKYNVQLIDATAEEFLPQLTLTWLAHRRTVITYEERELRQYHQVDDNTRFPKVAESYYHIRPEDCTGPAAPRKFFLGGEPTWPDIRDRIPPLRDAYPQVFEAILPDLVDPAQPPSVYLVTGAAGTGKTTLLRSLAFYLAQEEQLPILIHIPDTPLNPNDLLPLVKTDQPQRIVLVVHHAAECIPALEIFLDGAIRLHLPVTLLLEERTNQWAFARTSRRKPLSPISFELGSLSANEIALILAALEKHSALGRLTGLPRDVQVRHFESVADKELLVALRELTTGTNFDQIVRDEFACIPSDTGRRAYLYVAALGQIDLHLRYETLTRLLGIDFTQLRKEVFLPTEGVLLDCEATGHSRHAAGFRLRARHPVIAAIVFHSEAPDDNSKFSVLNDIISQLDVGYPEDKRILDQMVRRHDLLQTLAEPAKRRALYDRFEVVFPDSPFVFQQRSILERDLNDADQSIRFARRAVALDPRNPTLLNTLGLALEFAARKAGSPLSRQKMLAEATRIFQEGIRNYPRDAFNYLGQWYLQRQEIDHVVDPKKRNLLTLEALAVLEEAYEACDDPTPLVPELASLQSRLESLDSATDLVASAVAKNPSNARLRELWIRLEIRANHTETALNLALQSAPLCPTSWRIHRHIARLLKATNAQPEAVRGHYEAAIRFHKGDVDLLVELGAYLVTRTLYAEAKAVFQQAKQLPISGQEKRQPRYTWLDEHNNPRAFVGKIHSIQGAIGYILAIPENFTASFLRTNPKLAALQQDFQVKFHVKFSAHGILADVLC